ncbi:MAG: N-acetylneuraminate synthase family protein [Candidatus ainarchaeum sp.]|nr:N-acetylneuraminate synthase family protein [Candidatus ainarchaeum sp.]MDD5096757.1 N-acetylneuraminate synthase family protein [Candidatus ainarchaeum sp.]
MEKLRIGKRAVGEGEPCFVIAEAGSNHNGKLDQAKKLIDEAAKAGADAVKFQLFKAEKLYVKTAGSADYLKDGKSIFQIIKDMELPEEWLGTLSSYCDKHGIVFLSSVFDEESADLLDKYVPAHKIASYECNHIPLIRHVARKGKPVIISTGASTMEEIKDAVDAVHSEGGKLALLQCTAKYPAPLTAVNVKVVQTLRERFNVPTGFSDHSREPFIAPLAAVALGASIIEKHFTLDNNLPGPDHKFALEPGELKLLVEHIRGTEKALGTGEKFVLPEEKELYEFAKRSIHAIKDIHKGERFTNENIAALRPGKAGRGLPPKHLEQIIGKKAKRDIPVWKGIVAGDFE